MRFLLLALLIVCALCGCKSNVVEPTAVQPTVVKPDTGWHQVASMPVGRTYATGFTLNGKGYICGGYGFNDLYAYDPVANTWTKKAALPLYNNFDIGRRSPYSFVINNKAYAGGGLSNNGLGGTDLYEYDADKDQWITRAKYTTGLDQSAGTVYGNSGYIFGFSSQDYGIYKFDPSLNTIVALPFSSFFLSVSPDTQYISSFGNNLLLGAGYSFGDIETIDPFTYTTKGINYNQPLSSKPPYEKNMFQSAFCYKNCLYMSFGDLGKLYRFNFITGVWQIVSGSHFGITEGASMFLIGSKLYVTGGNDGFFKPVSYNNSVWEIDLDAYPE